MNSPLYDIGQLSANTSPYQASHEDPKWKTVFWGSNYPRLETLKKKYDPNNTFWCSPCIGADMFTYDDERICPNPAYPASGPPPQTLPNAKSKTGIASLPGKVGIQNPLLPYIKTYLTNHTIPQTFPDFDMDDMGGTDEG
jgi:Berberine and berberine like